MSRTPYRPSQPSAFTSINPRLRIMSQQAMHSQVPWGTYGISSSSPPTRSMQISRVPTASHPTFEPRVIRADVSQTTGATCPSSVSPPHTRRPSAPGGVVEPQSNSRSLVPRPSTHMDQVPFSPPTYLCYSALYKQLRTETPPSTPHRRTEPVGRSDRALGAGRSQRSPSVDSDDDDMSTPPRELRKSPPPVVSTSLPSLLLPTRWCEEYRNPLLTVSGDGRDLTYQQGEYDCAMCGHKRNSCLEPGASGSSDKDAATARTVVPVPPACGIYYFEVEVTGKAQKRYFVSYVCNLLLTDYLVALASGSDLRRFLTLINNILS